MRKVLLLALPGVFLLVVLFLSGGLHRGRAAAVDGSIAPGAVLANLAGRLIIDSSGSAQLVGYYPYIYGLPSDLFFGTADEATAYFTFRSSVFTINLLQNGNLLHLLSVPASGTTNVMSVYFNSYPNQNFADPTTFSAGQLVAQYSTVKFMGTASTYSGVETGTLALMSSNSFSFQGETYNFGNLSSATTISLQFGQPVSGSFMSGPAVVAFGGSAVGVGNSLETIVGRR